MKLHAAYLLPVFAFIVAGCGQKPAENPAETASKATESPKQVAANPSTLKDLKVEDLKVGTGKQVAQDGDLLIMTYKGTLKDGTVFDSTDDHGKTPFGFYLGMHQVIKGWDQGLKNMKVGGKRRLSIPPSLGYGDQDTGKIPPNSDLFFDVELWAIVKKGEEDIYDKKDIKIGSGRTVVNGSNVSLSYTMLYANRVEAAKEKISIKVGNGDVLAAIEAGIQGMKEGGERELTLPSRLLQNSMSVGGKIPTNQVMIFDVKVEKVG